MKKLLSIAVILAIMAPTVAQATTCEERDVTIKGLRAVSGAYPTEKHKNTVELHHETRNYCDLSDCAVTNRNRVVIDVSDEHIVSAAYMAFTAGKKVNILIDTRLGTRHGICVVSYLTVQQ